MRTHHLLILLSVVAVHVVTPPRLLAQVNIDEAPINYVDTADNNQVTALIEQVKSGDVKLEYDASTGYLRSLLKALDISESSQVLVFSKTSMQVRYISRRNPRAVYFSDDVYVAWVRGSSLMEISTSDPKLGAAFYTVNMTPRNAYIKRTNYECLGCHTTTMTQGVPGHTVRSVYPMVDGTIESQGLSFVTDHSSPFSQRWGGWYVTGRQGDMKHMGNAFLRGGILRASGDATRLNLRDDFNAGDWLTPYSDIVALMVLEHQTQMHNTFTRANFNVRRALHDHRLAYNLDDPETAKIVPEGDERELDAIIARAAEDVADYMLFVDETPLTSEIKGSIVFASDFTDRGPKDDRGRSLRDFDLKTRLFQFPLSYLIYSPSFDSMEERLRQHVFKRLWSILSGETESDRYSHLNAKTRESIVDILRSTKQDLPDDWHRPAEVTAAK